MTQANQLMVAVLVSIVAVVVQYLANLQLRRESRDAEARAEVAESELRKANEREIQTRQLLSMLSGQVEQTTSMVKIVQGQDEAFNALCHKMDATLERMVEDARKLHAATVLEDRGHERLVTVLNGEVAWLRRALAADRSHERAHGDLEAERLVRDAETRDTAIEHPPILGPILANTNGHRFSTQRRSEGPADEPIGMVREPVAVASAGGPVPGTE